MNSRPSGLWVIATLFLLAAFSQQIARLAVEGLWYASVDRLPVFWTVFATRLGAGLAAGLVTGALAAWSVRLAMSSARPRPVVLLDGRVELKPWSEPPMAAMSGQLARALGIGAAVLVGFGAQQAWRVWLSAWHAVPFGEIDPILGLDASFYVFTLPALQAVRGIVTAAIVIALGLAVLVYQQHGAIRVRLPDADHPDVAARLSIAPAARRHLGLLGACFGLTLAVGTFLQRHEAMSMVSGRFDGPGYAVVEVLLPLLTLSAIATVLASWLVYQALDREQPAAFALAVFLVFGAGALQSFAPSVVQRFVVTPNELEAERPYLAAHIEATRRAWQLEGVEERALGADATLALDDIDANRATIEGIRLWDEGPLRATFQQVQEIRTYYEFHHVDHDRYRVDGRLRQVMLSARELEPTGLPQQARTWLNETLVYTHGYGVTLGPVNEVTNDGLPRLWVKDLPPQASHDVFTVTKPAIYFGEEMRRPVIVGTRQAEFDFPTADGNATTQYEGEAGILAGGFARRALLALALGDIEVLLSGDITAGSRLLYVRQVQDRVQRVAPFLHIEGDAYMAIVDGRLLWFVDGFTHTDHYPASAHRTLPPAKGARVGPRANWVRNHVKVTVDAYDGTVTLWRMPGKDPVLDAWEAAFPGVLRPAADMPAGIREHVRVPATLFELQAHLFATYHMVDADTFYNREDQWEVPAFSVPGSRRTLPVSMTPYYTVLTLPGEGVDEFILMLPFTPRDKDNLAAWMVARNDGEHYGTLRVYRFPKDRLVYGPSQVVARIQQDDAISEKLTLWNQQGSAAILGTLLVIPVEESLLYVQPLYLQANDGAIPELKRVIVGWGDDIAMEPTLEGALAALFGAGARAVEATTPGTPRVASLTWQEAARRAQAAWEAVEAAGATGRFSDLGAALDDLGAAIEEITALSDGEDPVEPDAVE